MPQALYLQGFETPKPNAADQNRTSADIQKPHRKEDCASSSEFFKYTSPSMVTALTGHIV